jgi:hypothetical protein
MKIHPSKLLAGSALAATLLLSPTPSAGQSAEGFDTSGVVPAAPPQAAPAAPAPAPASATTDLGPSRYAGGEIPAYVRDLSARFSIRKRATDPFGRYQDPDFKAPEPKILAKSPTQRFKPEPPVAFADIIASISVNMVDPEKQQFLIAGRSFRKANIFPLQLPNGKQVKVQVVGVTATRIEFRNIDTGETAPLKLDMLPAGMKKGTGGISAPGIQPTGADAPIQVQPSSLPPISSNG